MGLRVRGTPGARPAPQGSTRLRCVLDLRDFSPPREPADPCGAGGLPSACGTNRPASVIGCLLYAYLLSMPGAERDREQNVQLRLERERRGWSQKQVAAAIGTNAVMVSRWECGVMKPGPHFRQRLCSL
ncbi:MAG: helix-turn-helix transcriptional regulator [Chloroflexi bacterium]|nr:MAG: helix-turn-helix transcriptional regulator [Chloroflexota bacterium]